MRMIRLALTKTLLNLALDFKFISSNPLPLSERITYVVRKYVSILGNHRRIQFLGRPLFFDNRLTPALLPEYVVELTDLDRAIHLAQIHTVLDIGANIGQFSRVFKWINPGARIYSFEPNPDAFALLQQNASGFEGWTCLPFGVGRSNERVPFYFVNEKSGQGSVFAGNASQGLLSEHCRRIDVELKELDPVMVERLGLPDQVDLIKIDVEGAELEVLGALSGVRWRYLYVELSENREGGASLEEAISALKASSNGPIEVVQRSEAAGQGSTFQALLRSAP